MNKLTSIKIKYNNGTYSDEIPIGVLADNVDWDSTHSLTDIVGNTSTLASLSTAGTIMGALNKLNTDKVDKVSGKGLSTNDYTTNEKNKLAGIDAGANQTTVDSAISSTSTNPVQNKVIYSGLSSKLEKTGDSKDVTTTFTSSDTTDANASAWTSVTTLASAEKHSSIFAKVSQMFKNVRYLFKMLGTTDISSIGNGTVSGALSTLNTSTTDLANRYVFSSSTSDFITKMADLPLNKAFNIQTYSSLTSAITNGASSSACNGLASKNTATTIKVIIYEPNTGTNNGFYSAVLDTSTSIWSSLYNIPSGMDYVTLADCHDATDYRKMYVTNANTTNRPPGTASYWFVRVLGRYHTDLNDGKVSYTIIATPVNTASMNIYIKSFNNTGESNGWTHLSDTSLLPHIHTKTFSNITIPSSGYIQIWDVSTDSDLTFGPILSATICGFTSISSYPISVSISSDYKKIYLMGVPNATIGSIGVRVALQSSYSYT